MPDPADRVYLQVLVVRCQLGDRNAFAELVARCQPRLRAFLHKMLPESQNADDVMQDVWMDVFKDLPRLNDCSAFMPWLYRIAHNRCFRMLRNRREPQACIDDLPAAETADDESDFTAEDAAVVHEALGKLSAEHREILLLRFLEDMSYEEIARVVMRPVGTVRSRIHNAKMALRRILETARLP